MNKGEEFSIKESIKFYFTTLTQVASLLLLATVFAYGFITVHYQAYLNEFGVDINVVSFLPSVYDLTIWGFIAIGVLFVFLLFFVIFNASFNKFFKYISRFRYLKWLDPGDSDTQPKYYNQAYLIIMFSIVSFLCIYYIGEQTGKDRARDQKQFTVVTSGSSNNKKKVLLYQNANSGVFVDYDIRSRSFSKAYEIRELSGLTFRIEDLDR